MAQVLLGARSEQHWLRLCDGRLATLCPSWADELRLVDATPVPYGTSRETVKRSDLVGWANYGYCASHSRWCGA